MAPSCCCPWCWFIRLGTEADYSSIQFGHRGHYGINLGHHTLSKRLQRHGHGDILMGWREAFVWTCDGSNSGGRLPIIICHLPEVDEEDSWLFVKLGFVQ